MTEDGRWKREEGSADLPAHCLKTRGGSGIARGRAGSPRREIMRPVQSFRNCGWLLSAGGGDEFEDGVFVVAADPAELVGCELLAVAGVPIEELHRMLAPVVAHDNEWTIRARRPTFVVTAEVLQGLGIVDQIRHASFDFRTPTGN